MKSILLSCLLAGLLASCSLPTAPGAAVPSPPSLVDPSPPGNPAPPDTTPPEEYESQRDGELTMRVSGVTLGDEGCLTAELDNRTGESAQVVLIPALERRDGEDWTRVEFAAGFCGTPDSVGEFRTVSIPFSLYRESLLPGEYRLSYSVGEAHKTLSAIFTLPDYDPSALSLNALGDRFGLPGDTTKLSVELVNSGASDAVFGSAFTVEARDSDGAWMPFGDKQPAFEEIGWLLGADARVERELDLSLWSDAYPEGHYRVVIELFPSLNADVPVRVPLRLEFSIECK